MITIPSVLNYKSVAVYPDDEDCNLFYAIKTIPEIRVVDGQPVFSGLFWTDKADGDTTSVAGLAGGWINFDAYLSVSEDDLKDISSRLQSGGVQDSRRRVLVKKEKERLGLIAKARGDNNIPDPDVPAINEIRFGALNYTSGTVTLLEQSGGDLIPWSSAGGPASLIGDNNAAFALRLSPTGAAIWYKSLKEGNKAISIRYDLKFMMRLPSLEIHAWAGSTQKSDIQRKVERVWKNVDQGCSDADVERIDVKAVTEKLSSEELVHIEIKKGSSEISEENETQLKTFALKIIEEKVSEIIKNRIHGMTEEERKNSMIELMSEEINSFVELNFTQEDVVEWGISPQGTIMDFLEGISEAKKSHITQLVDLSVMEVETFTLNTMVSAPWEEPPFVTTVKVNINSRAAGKERSLLFQKDTPKDVWHFRPAKNDTGQVEYVTEVSFRGISEPVVLPPKTSNGDININIGKLGLIDVTFLPHPILSLLSGPNEVKAVQVDLSYKKEGDPDYFTDTVILKTDKPDGEKYSRIMGKLIDAPLVYKATYFAKDGSSVVMPEKKYYLTENNNSKILVESPYQDVLELSTELPQSPDASVKKIIVEFEYQDAANNFSSYERVELSAEDQWEPVTAKIVLVDKTQSKFKYCYRIVSTDAIAKSGWIDGQGEQAIILPILKVNVNASQLKLGTGFLNALLTLDYTSGDTHTTREVLLGAESAATMISWYIPRTNTNEVEYNYKLTLIKADSSQVESSGTNKGSFLILKLPA